MKPAPNPQSLHFHSQDHRFCFNCALKLTAVNYNKFGKRHVLNFVCLQCTYKVMDVITDTQ